MALGFQLTDLGGEPSSPSGSVYCCREPPFAVLERFKEIASLPRTGEWFFESLSTAASFAKSHVRAPRGPGQGWFTDCAEGGAQVA